MRASTAEDSNYAEKQEAYIKARNNMLQTALVSAASLAAGIGLLYLTFHYEDTSNGYFKVTDKETNQAAGYIISTFKRVHSDFLNNFTQSLLTAGLVLTRVTDPAEIQTIRAIDDNDFSFFGEVTQNVLYSNQFFTNIQKPQLDTVSKALQDAGGFKYDAGELFLLTAIAGLGGVVVGIGAFISTLLKINKAKTLQQQAAAADPMNRPLLLDYASTPPPPGGGIAMIDFRGRDDAMVVETSGEFLGDEEDPFAQPTPRISAAAKLALFSGSPTAAAEGDDADATFLPPGALVV